MPKSKRNSKSTARAAYTGGLPRHPALAHPDCMLMCRMGSEDAMRLPDQYSQPTAATVLPDDVTITANADGDFVHAIHYRLGYVNQTVTAGTTAGASTVTNTQRYTSFTTAARLARVVCVKVQIMYIGAEMSSAGYISVSQKSSITDITSMTMAALHNNADRQIRAQEGLTSFIGYRQEPRFESPTDNTFMYGTFPVFIIAGSGIPAGANIKVRVLRFMEFQPIEGDLSEGSVEMEPYNPGALAVSSQLNTVTTSMHTASEAPGFISTLKSAANAAYHLAQPLMPYVASEARAFLKDKIGTTAAAFAPLLLAM